MILHLNPTRVLGLFLEPLPKFPPLDGTMVQSERIEEDDFPIVQFLDSLESPKEDLLWPVDSQICIRFLEDYGQDLKELYAECGDAWTKYDFVPIRIVFEDIS